MARTIKWTVSAINDLEEVVAFIARDSRFYAISVVKEARNAARSLALGAWLKSPFANLKKLKNLTSFKPDEPESEDLVCALKDVSLSPPRAPVVKKSGLKT